MSVNTMNFNQASTVLNAIHAQVTGKTSLAPIDDRDWVSVATKTLAVGTDPVINAITQLVGRTIFSSRPYYRKFAGLQVDNQRWGAITRKLNISDKAFDDDSGFQLVDGQSVDMYKVNKPNILATNFYGSNVFTKDYTIFKDQFMSAFTGPEQFGEFMTMITTNAQNMVEQSKENLARACVGNFIVGKVAASADVVHLLTEYNAETGLSPALDAQTVMQPANFPAFAKWCYARIQKISNMMTERTDLYQIQVTGKEITRHTPKEDQRVYLYAPLLEDVSARVLADTFHDSFIRFTDTEAVNFWQSANTPDTINAQPVYLKTDGTLETGAAAQTVSPVFGVIFDKEAMGYNVFNEDTNVTPINAKGRYWNVFMNYNIRYWNDFTEKGVVLVLD